MSEDELAPYVRKWELARARGKDLSPMELCADRPDLISRLVDRLQQLRSSSHQALSALPPLYISTDHQLEIPEMEESPDESSPPDPSVRSDLSQPSGEFPRQIAGYRMLSLIGKGGMGAVFEAEDVKLGRRVAVKLILPGWAAHPKPRARFLREARAQAGIDHDNITPIYHYGEEKGWLYVVMPLLKGETLRSRLQRQSTFPIELVLRIAHDMVQGLAAAHEQGVVHRDMKPGNIWLDGEPNSPDTYQQIRRCRILDFGLARSFDSEDSEVTGTGEVLGTPSYMSPEQAAGEKVDHRTDLFAVGVMMYEMATGKRPFEGPTAVATILNIATVTPPPADSINPDIPPYVSKLISTLMAKNREERPLSARLVLNEIDKIIQLIEKLKEVSRPEDTHSDLVKNPPPRLGKTAPSRSPSSPVSSESQIAKPAPLKSDSSSSTPTPRPLPGLDDASMPVIDEILESQLPDPLDSLNHVERETREDLTPPPSKQSWRNEPKMSADNNEPTEPELPEPKRPWLLWCSMPLVVLAIGTVIYFGMRGGSSEAVVKPPIGTGLSPTPTAKDTPKETPKDPDPVKTPALPRVVVRVNVPNATVQLMGEKSKAAIPGDKPNEFVFDPAPATTFRLMVEKPGYVASSIEVNIADKTVYQVDLAMETMRVNLKPLPMGATVDFVDDPTAKPTGPGTFEIQRKRQTVKVSYPGYREITATVPLPLAGKNEVDIELAYSPLPEITNSLDMKLKLIPPGEFTMAGTGGTADRQVTISRGFYLGQLEVTRQQFDRFVREHGYRTDAERSSRGGEGYDPKSRNITSRGKEFDWRNPGFTQENDHPVVNVSWNDAQQFCEWLSKKEARRYRLPTEAEWDYASRPNTQTLLPFAEEAAVVVKHANVADKSLISRLKADNPSINLGALTLFAGEVSDGFAFTAPTGRFSPNGFGVNDMFGNVFEWCEDWYGSNAELPTRDPVQVKPDKDNRRVSRGGSFLTLRIADMTGRRVNVADSAWIEVGFRVLMEVQQPQALGAK